MKRLIVFLSLSLAVFAQKVTNPPSAASGWTDNGTTVSTTRTVSVSTVLLVPITISTSGPVTVTAWGFYLNNAAGALTYTLPAITSGTVGTQFCFRNDTGKSGAITLQLPAATTADKDGADGSAAGTLVSGGAVGDAACVVAKAVGKYLAYVGAGSWTNN